MRRYGVPEPYEKLKAFTRGQRVTQHSMQVGAPAAGAAIYVHAVFVCPCRAQVATPRSVAHHTLASYQSVAE